MTNINFNDLPLIDGERVSYEVPADTFVLKHSGTVYAGPGDHIHGQKHPEGWQLDVYDGDRCGRCAAEVKMPAALERGLADSAAARVRYRGDFTQYNAPDPADAGEPG